jgi:hypothetical protein
MESTLIGRTGFMKLGGYDVEFEVLDSSVVFAGESVMIKPVAGVGRGWIAASQLRLRPMPGRRKSA